MKKRIFSCLLSFLGIFLLSNMAHAQVSIGPRLGIQTNATQLSGANTPQELAELDFEGKLGFRLGLFARAQLGILYIQPEVLMTTSQSTYSFRDAANASNIQFRDENGINLDIPAIIGLKFDVFRVQAGPVATFNLSQNSEFEDKEGWTRDFQPNNWGLQMGIGFDLWRFVLDLNYQVPLNKGTEGITVGGQTYELNQNDGTIVLTLGIDLTKNRDF